MFKLLFIIKPEECLKNWFWHQMYAFFYSMPVKFSPTFQTAYVEYTYQILDTGHTGCHIKENQHLNLLLILTL